MGDDDESPHEMHKASHTGGRCGSRLDIHGIDGRGSGTEEAIYTDACEGSDESRYIKYKGKMSGWMVGGGSHGEKAEAGFWFLITKFLENSFI